MKTYYEWEQQWFENQTRTNERLGQAFLNEYIKAPMPELFYADTPIARLGIYQWLIENNYWPYVPEYKNSMKENVDVQEQRD
jgi:hypothetical protein